MLKVGWVAVLKVSCCQSFIPNWEHKKLRDAAIIIVEAMLQGGGVVVTMIREGGISKMTTFSN